METLYRGKLSIKHSKILVYIEFQLCKDNNGDQREPARPAGHNIDNRLYRGILLIILIIGSHSGEFR